MTLEKLRITGFEPPPPDTGRQRQRQRERERLLRDQETTHGQTASHISAGLSSQKLLGVQVGHQLNE
jgi:hypothetical protein